jgi:hypothetical protein
MLASDPKAAPAIAKGGPHAPDGSLEPGSRPRRTPKKASDRLVAATIAYGVTHILTINVTDFKRFQGFVQTFLLMIYRVTSSAILRPFAQHWRRQNQKNYG